MRSDLMRPKPSEAVVSWLRINVHSIAIAATARVARAKLATRNVDDFTTTRLKI